MSRSSCGWSAVARFLLMAALGAAAAPVHAAPVEIRGVRHSSTSERTRIVIDLSRPSAYEHRALTDPDRVLVAVEDAAVASAAAAREIGDGFVRRVRLNSLAGGKAQVVLELERALPYQTFTLADPPRIVVDVAHGGPAAPDPPRRDPEEPRARAEPPAGSGDGAGDGSAPAARKVIPAQAPEHGTWVIAIDAGHGGQDPGSSHHGAREKDIALALAREVHRELDGRPGIRSFLVRKGDYFIPLRRRRTLAEEQGAHLFVSIHCDGLDRPDARGTSVYFLSLTGASDEASRELAERENRVDRDMGVAGTGDDLDAILFDMTQTDVLAKSQLLAETSLAALLDLGTVYDRGVKQAGFAVLKSPRIPSILVEAAFISNPAENKLLRDPKWQRRFGKHLADGIESYCRSVTGSE